METVKNLKGSLRLWFLKKAMGRISREKKLMGYHQARYIGIIYDASNEDNYQWITHRVRDLQQDQKKVKTMGFVNQKKMPSFAFPKLIFEFANSNDFSLNQEPKSPQVIDFAKNNFDILIDLTPSGFHHMKYLSAVSAAQMRVGRYVKKYVDIYDLMIQVDDASTIQETYEQVLLYLKMINNDTQS